MQSRTHFHGPPRSSILGQVETLTLADVYAVHADFIWKTLHRLGVREPHVEDVFQDVLMVVFQRLGSYKGDSALTTWLFGICFRVVSQFRRRFLRRREQVMTDESAAATEVWEAPNPEEEAVRREAENRLNAILDELKLEQRAAFVMFELEGLECEQIAEMVGVPVGTIHSRLHAARKAFTRALARHQARDARRGR